MHQAGAVFQAVTGDRMMGMVSSPQVFADGVVLPKSTALEAFESGNYNRVPFITGTNRDESKLFQLARFLIKRLLCNIKYSKHFSIYSSNSSVDK